MLSDFMLMPIGDTWIGFRHVREVDGVVLDPLYKGVARQEFDETIPKGRHQLLERLTFESIRYNIGDFVRPANLPTFPLEILDTDNLKLFSFSDAGGEILDGVQVTRVNFRERLLSSFIMDTGVGPALRVSLSGTFWIEPSTGRIFQSEVTFADPQHRKTEMKMSVRFRPDPKLEMLVPVSMEEHFRDPVTHHQVDCNADYQNFRHFETGVQLGDPADGPVPPPPDPDLWKRGEDHYAVKVDVHLVSLNAWVTARTGMAVADLKAEDFQALENGSEQTITHFSPVDTPFDVLLLFDHSGSTETKWTLMQRATEEFISNLRPQDRAVVANFDTSLRVLTRWTDSRDQIINTITNLNKGKRPGGTAFYKAVEQSLAAELPPVSGRRRALVVLTDGRDNGLFNVLFQQGHLLPPQEEPAFQRLMTLVKRERIPVYVVAVNGFSSSEEVNLINQRFASPVGDEYLEAVRTRLELIAESSGGRVMFANKFQDVIPLYKQISHELAAAYSIGYVSNIPPSVTGFREITLLTRDRRLHVIQSRPGYTLDTGLR
jgi:VWFA-related protein